MKCCLRLLVRFTPLKSSVLAAQSKFAASKQDDSILQIFLERAASQIDRSDASAPSADEWRSAKVILNTVVPAYHAAKKPAAVLPRSNTKAVQLTLVRWPYT